MPEVLFDRYYRYEELTRVLRDCAAQFPQLVALESIGKSYEGREIWLLAVTNRETGEAAEKPALWVDGNIHATELAASSACLYLLQFLLKHYGSDAEIARCLDTRAFYICPRANPDGAELALADSPKFIRSGTRIYPHRDRLREGLVSEDIDGDGRILMMRIPDANGAWKVSADDPRLMVPREPAETGGEYYRLLPEGRIENYDGALIPANPPPEGLDFNRNFPSKWRQEYEQHGAGPYPASESEVRSLVQFIADRPNITGAVAFHTMSGVLLRPYSYQSDDEFPVEDFRTYSAIAAKGTQLTDYPAISVFHDFRSNPKEHLTGAFDDWMYEGQGVFAWTVEIWSPMRQAGIADYHYIDWFRQHSLEDDFKMLRWNDEQLNGQGYVDWYSFEHPQLGPIELGGWNELYTWRNPPTKLLEAEVARFPRWLVWHLLISPRLEICETLVVPLGQDAYHIRLVVQNTGWLPTYIAKKALEKKLVSGCLASIQLPAGATLIAGKPQENLGQLEGRNNKPSAPTWHICDPTEDRAKVEWVVRSPAGGTAVLEVRHDRAGTVRATVKLG